MQDITKMYIIIEYRVKELAVQTVWSMASLFDCGGLACRRSGAILLAYKRFYIDKLN